MALSLTFFLGALERPPHHACLRPRALWVGGWGTHGPQAWPSGIRAAEPKTKSRGETAARSALPLALGHSLHLYMHAGHEPCLLACIPCGWARPTARVRSILEELASRRCPTHLLPPPAPRAPRSACGWSCRPAGLACAGRARTPRTRRALPLPAQAACCGRSARGYIHRGVLRRWQLYDSTARLRGPAGGPLFCALCAPWRGRRRVPP